MTLSGVFNMLFTTKFYSVNHTKPINLINSGGKIHSYLILNQVIYIVTNGLQGVTETVVYLLQNKAATFYAQFISILSHHNKFELYDNKRGRQAQLVIQTKLQSPPDKGIE
jgi:hypothetical protein